MGIEPWEDQSRPSQLITTRISLLPRLSCPPGAPAAFLGLGTVATVRKLLGYRPWPSRSPIDTRPLVRSLPATSLALSAPIHRYSVRPWGLANRCHSFWVSQMLGSPPILPGPFRDWIRGLSRFSVRFSLHFFSLLTSAIYAIASPLCYPGFFALGEHRVPWDQSICTPPRSPPSAKQDFWQSREVS